MKREIEGLNKRFNGGLDSPVQREQLLYCLNSFLLAVEDQLRLSTWAIQLYKMIYMELSHQC